MARRRRARHGAAARRGLALPLTVCALVVVGALAAGMLFAATQAQRAARYGLTGERALAVAERAAARAPLVWRGDALAAAPVGSAVEATVDAADARAVLRVTRVTARTAVAVAEGTSGVGRGRARRVVTGVFEIRGAAPDSSQLAPVTPRAWVVTF